MNCNRKTRSSSSSSSTQLQRLFFLLSATQLVNVKRTNSLSQQQQQLELQGELAKCKNVPNGIPTLRRKDSRRICPCSLHSYRVETLILSRTNLKLT